MQMQRHSLLRNDFLLTNDVLRQMIAARREDGRPGGRDSLTSRRLRETGRPRNATLQRCRRTRYKPPLSEHATKKYVGHGRGYQVRGRRRHSDLCVANCHAAGGQETDQEVPQTRQERCERSASPSPQIIFPCSAASRGFALSFLFH